ncbi:MAG: hypothetical protein PHR71_07720, partial [Polaromonas sp.]|nr:hypothetical protein [Polaromonas sp.]
FCALQGNAVKLLKNRLLMFHRNPHASVPDLNALNAASASGSQKHTAMARVFQGIRQQVADQTLEHDRIRSHLRHCYPGSELQAALPGNKRILDFNLLHQPAKIKQL